MGELISIIWAEYWNQEALLNSSNPCNYRNGRIRLKTASHLRQYYGVYEKTANDISTMQSNKHVTNSLRAELQQTSDSQNQFQALQTHRVISHSPVLILPRIDTIAPIPTTSSSSQRSLTPIVNNSTAKPTRRGGNRGLCKTCGHERAAFKEFHIGRGHKCMNPNIVPFVQLPCTVLDCLLATDHFHECTCQKCVSIVVST